MDDHGSSPLPFRCGAASLLWLETRVKCACYFWFPY
jgi:hypothetical protein